MTNKSDDGGPAFPLAITEDSTDYHGMSLRDYFAGQVLAGFMSAKPMHFTPDEDAGYCYRVADVMIAARSVADEAPSGWDHTVKSIEAVLSTPRGSRVMRRSVGSLPSEMSDEENQVLNHLVAAWNAFVYLPIEHPDQQAEFRHALHDLQRQIMVRPVRRAAALGASKKGRA